MSLGVFHGSLNPFSSHSCVKKCRILQCRILASSKVGWGLGLIPSLVPRPSAFVACSTKFAQRAWARSSRDVCRSLRHVHSTGINDVIDELEPSLALKEAHRDHSNGSCANLPNGAKSLSSERAQAAMFSWIVDVYIQLPCHIVLLGRPWISAPHLLQLRFTIVVYRTRVTCFRFFQLHLWLSLQPMLQHGAAISGVT